jgi:4,5-DOPA dioxygenase extradiol
MAFPALFVSHGAPSVALEENEYARALRAWAGARPKPRAIAIVSAHGEALGPPRLNSALRPSLIYDFYGFPPALYQLSYAAPGAPDLARELADALASQGLEPVLDSRRGWDHGVWVPLRLLYPGADVPVIELSLPVPRTSELLLGMGRALAPFRRRGLLLMGSGGIVHNLHRLAADGAPPEPWAVAFDRWTRERVAAFDLPALIDYATQAPDAELAVPTTEHFDPLFFVMGGRDARDRVEDICEGFRYGSVSMRSFALVSQ